MENKEKVDYEFLIQDYLESYRFYHSEHSTEKMIKKMIEKKHIAILPAYLRVLSKEFLSLKLSRMILKKLEQDPENNKDLEKYLPIIANRNKIDKKKENEYKLKRVAMVGVAATLCVSGIKIADRKFETQENKTIETTENQSTNQTQIKKLEILEDGFLEEYFIEEQRLKKEQEAKEERLRKKKQEAKRKQKILNNYYKCNTIEKIKKRQKQLESLDLKKSDKIYKNCKLSAAKQRFIFEQAAIYKLPADLLFTIIHTETRGNFASSGVEHYNEPSNSYDLGLTQQNSKYSLPSFQQKYKLSYNKAYKLLRDNDYANICWAMQKCKGISARLDGYNAHEIAGGYNGGPDWRKNSISQAYVKIFDAAYDNIYTKHHNVVKSKQKQKTKVKQNKKSER